MGGRTTSRSRSPKHSHRSHSPKHSHRSQSSHSSQRSHSPGRGSRKGRRSGSPEPAEEPKAPEPEAAAPEAAEEEVPIELIEEVEKAAAGLKRAGLVVEGLEFYQQQHGWAIGVKRRLGGAADLAEGQQLLADGQEEYAARVWDFLSARLPEDELCAVVASFGRLMQARHAARAGWRRGQPV